VELPVGFAAIAMSKSGAMLNFLENFIV
jgi:hypothetical protein